MKRFWQFLFWGLFLFLYSNECCSQNHVSWTYRFDVATQQVIVTGKIDSTWHIYSPKTNPSLGPIPLTAQMIPDKNVKLKGEVVFMTEPFSYNDENFGGVVYVWENEMTLRQNIKCAGQGTVNLILNYMACNVTQCLPPVQVELTIPIKSN